MFGATVDYRLLRLLVRPRSALVGPKPGSDSNDSLGRSSSSVIASMPPPPAPPSVADGVARLRKFNDRIGGRLPLAGRLRYLDVGCGFGDMTVALALESGGVVKGVDVVAKRVEAARRLAESASLDSSRVGFERAGWDDLAPDEKFDVVLSHEALEHYAEPLAFLTRARSLMRDERSKLLLGFGPFFHALFNGHVDWIFRIRIPWLVLIFSEAAILRLRYEHARPWDPASRWEDVEGGLNQIRVGEFLRGIENAGLATDCLIFNCQLRRWPLLRALSSGLMRVPWVRDYFAFSAYGVFRRA